MWITGKTAVKAAYKQLFAFNVGDGKPTWDALTFPQKICAVTPQKTADDKVVVAYMSGTSSSAKCNQLQQIDLNTGAKGWSGKVADGALFDSALSVDLSITGNTLTVGRSMSGTAYDVSSGKKLWDKEKYGAGCYPAAIRGRRQAARRRVLRRRQRHRARRGAGAGPGHRQGQVDDRRSPRAGGSSAPTPSTRSSSTSPTRKEDGGTSPR